MLLTILSSTKKMSKWLFSKKEDEEYLIEKNNENCVCNDSSCKTHKDNAVLQDTIWNDISTRVGKSVDEYKNYWKYIRDICMVSQNKDTGSVAKSKKNQSFSTRTPFLDTIYKRKSTVGEIEDELEGFNVPLLKKK